MSLLVLCFMVCNMAQIVAFYCILFTDLTLKLRKSLMCLGVYNVRTVHIFAFAQHSGQSSDAPN